MMLHMDEPGEGPIYHLALAGDWGAAVANADIYLASTLGRSLEEEGFIHCSFAHQVQRIADLSFRGRQDVVLLTIGVQRLRSPVRVEALEGAHEPYPHIYGPLNIDAVTEVKALAPQPDGRLIAGV